MSQQLCGTILPDEHGLRLDQVLVRRANDDSSAQGDQLLMRRATGDSSAQNDQLLSRARLQQLIGAGGAVLLEADGKRVSCRASTRVKQGQHFQVNVPPPTQDHVVPQQMALDVLYEDEDLLVINKAAGVVVHAGSGVTGPTLVAGLLAHCQDLSGIGGVLRPGIVHRLDAGTTGAMVVAKNDVSHVHLAGQFAQRLVQKQYVAAIVRPSSLETSRLRRPWLGPKDMSWQMISGDFSRHPTDRRRFTSRPTKSTKTRLAKTWWRVVASHGALALIDVVLETGRTHQVRVHMAEHLGPVLADPLYRTVLANAPLKRGGYAHMLTALNHQALHAAVLTFAHPRSGATICCHAPLPRSWAHLAKTLADTRPQPPMELETRAPFSIPLAPRLHHAVWDVSAYLTGEQACSDSALAKY